MEGLDKLLGDLARDPVFIAVYLAVLLSFLKFIAGTVRAGLDKVFHFPAWDAWVRKDSPQILYPLIWIVGGKAISLVDTSSVPGLPADLIGGSIIGYGLIQLASFIIAAFSSLKDSIQPVNPIELNEKVVRAVEMGSPIPGTVPTVPPA